MIFLVAIIGGLLGRFLIGGILNFIFKPDDEPNPENYLGWMGAVIGVVISSWIYY